MGVLGFWGFGAEEARELLLAEMDAIIQAIPDAVYFGTPEGITRCNAKALEMLGALSLEDLQQRIVELGESFRVRYSEQRDDLSRTGRSPVCPWTER